MIDLKFNEYQTSIEDLHLTDYPEEIQEQFYDFITNVFAFFEAFFVIFS